MRINMGALELLAANIELANKKENIEWEMSGRQLRTSPHSQSFLVKYPVAQKDYSNEELQKRLAQTCRDIGDVQKSSTNVKASMTGWLMHEINPDFMEVCRMAIEFANECSPRGVPLMPNDCWGAIYSKGNYSDIHEHWPQIWSWVYNVECCEDCSPLIFDDTYKHKYSIYPKSGNMILFPGWIRHSVPEHQCDHDRIILAGNLGINPWTIILGLEKRNASSMNEEFKNMAEWLPYD